jgi:hypothetical protein
MKLWNMTIVSVIKTRIQVDSTPWINLLELSPHEDALSIEFPLYSLSTFVSFNIVISLHKTVVKISSIHSRFLLLIANRYCTTRINWGLHNTKTRALIGLTAITEWASWLNNPQVHLKPSRWRRFAQKCAPLQFPLSKKLQFQLLILRDASNFCNRDAKLYNSIKVKHARVIEEMRLNSFENRETHSVNFEFQFWIGV